MNFASILKRILFSFAGLIFAFAVLEVLFRMFSPLPYVDWQSANVFLPEDPRVFALKPNFADRFSGVFVKTNSLGFRDREVSQEKAGEKRILGLGDSVLFGYQVEEGKNVFDQLEKNMQSRGLNIVAINLGVPAYGLPHEVETYKMFGEKLYADLVVVHFVLNDVKKGNVLEITRTSFAKEEELNKSPGRKVFKWILGHSKLWSVTQSFLPNVLFNIGYSKRFDKNDAGDIEKDSMALIHKNIEINESYKIKADEAWNRIENSVAVLKQLTEEDNIPLIFVIYPWREQISKKCQAAYQDHQLWRDVPLDDYALSGAPQRRLAEILIKHNVDFLDLLGDFRMENARYTACPLMLDRNHLSALGHGVAARSLESFLLEKKLIN